MRNFSASLLDIFPKNQLKKEVIKPLKKVTSSKLLLFRLDGFLHSNEIPSYIAFGLRSFDLIFLRPFLEE